MEVGRKRSEEVNLVSNISTAELKSGLLGPSRNPFSPTTRQLCREGLSLYNTKIHPHHDI